ncbi:hypothetical protein EDB89DRAFT_2187747 [Lactarius sanguifluus]|nr:hypothetical protein EDB89DRAFT_2187747 [Lactarius sanguifluus]
MHEDRQKLRSPTLLTGCMTHEVHHPLNFQNGPSRQSSACFLPNATASRGMSRSAMPSPITYHRPSFHRPKRETDNRYPIWQSVGSLTWSGSAPVVLSLEITFREGNGNPTMKRGVWEGVRLGFSADSIGASRSCSLGSGSVNHAGGIDHVRDEARKERVARDNSEVVLEPREGGGHVVDAARASRALVIEISLAVATGFTCFSNLTTSLALYKRVLVPRAHSVRRNHISPVARAGEGATSAHHEAVQGKGRHNHIEHLEVDLGCIVPYIARNGERHAWRECRGEQGGRIVHLDVDIGHGPRKDVDARPVAVDEHALQRPHVLGSMGMSRNIRKHALHVASILKTRKCCDAQRDKSLQDEMSQCKSTILRRGGNCDAKKEPLLALLVAVGMGLVYPYGSSGAVTDEQGASKQPLVFYYTRSSCRNFAALELSSVQTDMTPKITTQTGHSVHPGVLVMKEATDESPESCPSRKRFMSAGPSTRQTSVIQCDNRLLAWLELTFKEGEGNFTTRCSVRGSAWGFLQTAEARRGVARSVPLFKSGLSSGSVTNAGGMGDVRDESPRHAKSSLRATKSVSQFNSTSAARTRLPREDRRPDKAITGSVVGVFGGLLGIRDNEVVLEPREGGGHVVDAARASRALVIETSVGLRS